MRLPCWLNWSAAFLFAVIAVSCEAQQPTSQESPAAAPAPSTQVTLAPAPVPEPKETTAAPAPAQKEAIVLAKADTAKGQQTAAVAGDLKPPEGPWGHIKGRVVWDKDQLPEAKALNVDKDQEWCLGAGPVYDESIVVDPKNKGIANVFAFLKLKKPFSIHPSYPQTKEEVAAQYTKRFEELNKIKVEDLQKALGEGKIKAKDLTAPATVYSSDQPAWVDQVRCRFAPHALGVRLGQKSLVRNAQPIADAVKVTSIEGLNEANLNIPPNTALFLDWLPERHPLNITCSLHAWEQMYAMVFDHPYFCVTGADGVFVIRNVPAGELNIILRKPRYIDPIKGGKGRSKGAMITVKPGEILDLGEIKYSE